MADEAKSPAEKSLRTNAGAYRFVAWFGLAYLFDSWWQGSNWLTPLWGLQQRLQNAGSAWALPADLLWHFAKNLPPIFSTALILVTIGTGITFAARTWSRAPAGTPRDPLIRVRNWLRAHPKTRTVLAWWPLLAVLAFTPHEVSRQLAYARSYGYPLFQIWMNVAMTLAETLPVIAVQKLGLRMLDRMEDRTLQAPTAVAGDEISFRAVAVTTRTQALVLAATGASIAMIASVSSADPSFFFSSKMGIAIAGYAAAMMALANWFRRASNIAVGVDGVLVHGTSKTKFYAYRDFDTVRSSGAALALVRGDKTLVRLQLHGEDVARGNVLGDRIRRALELSKSTSSAETLAGGAGAGLGRAALGAADYRQPSLSREQLWELVEGDGTQGNARAAAAEALSLRLDKTERTRLRIAVSHCADPKVRIAIESLVTPTDAEDAEDAEGENAADGLLKPAVGRIP